MGYNAQDLVNALTFYGSSGTSSTIASETLSYDGDLRPTSLSATWQSGSGTSGTIFAENTSYDPASNVISDTLTQAVVPSKTGSGGSETQDFCYDEQNRLVWAGKSGTEPSAGNGTCGSATLSNSLSGASYASSYVYTHLGQLWQGPLNGTGSDQYLYCNSSQPHQLTAVAAAGSTCSSNTPSYKASYNTWGEMTSRIANGVTGTLAYDGLDDLVRWTGTNGNEQWNWYDGSGQRVLQRTSTSGTIAYTVYAFGLEEHKYNASGSNSANLSYYTVGGQLVGEQTSTTSKSTTFLLTDLLGSVLASFSNILAETLLV